MRRGSWHGWLVLLVASGCATAPPLDNPVTIRTPENIENPVMVSPGAPTAASYREVFETCLDVLDDHFEIFSANPYSGVIITLPRIAPGYEQFWKGGNPDPRNRLLATWQTVRHYAVVTIRTSERGGYLVEVVVEKEMEDIPRPVRSTVGDAVFTETPTVDRAVEVVGPAVTTATRTWFKIGRDHALEQQLLDRIRCGK